VRFGRYFCGVPFYFFGELSGEVAGTGDAGWGILPFIFSTAPRISSIDIVEPPVWTGCFEAGFAASSFALAGAASATLEALEVGALASASGGIATASGGVGEVDESRGAAPPVAFVYC
jgi:hypothetical protein